MEFLIVILILATFALVAWRWGYDSSEVTPATDWERRRSLERMTSYRHL